MEAFPGRLPREILAEVLYWPVGYLEELLEVKAYVHAYHLTNAADTAEARKRLPTTPLFRLVTEIDFDLAEEDRKEA